MNFRKATTNELNLWFRKGSGNSYLRKLLTKDNSIF